MTSRTGAADMEGASRSFTIGLNTIIRMRGQATPDALETKELALGLMMASAYRHPSAAEAVRPPAAQDGNR
jgi:hypothetical protein